jgi:hypothetical protein
MTWDLILVTVTLVTVLLLIILLALVSRIWEDRTPQSREQERKNRPASQSRSVKVEKVGEHENSLA